MRLPYDENPNLVRNYRTCVEDSNSPFRRLTLPPWEGGRSRLHPIEGEENGTDDQRHDVRRVRRLGHARGDKYRSCREARYRYLDEARENRLGHRARATARGHRSGRLSPASESVGREGTRPKLPRPPARVPNPSRCTAPRPHAPSMTTAARPHDADRRPRCTCNSAWRLTAPGIPK